MDDASECLTRALNDLDAQCCHLADALRDLGKSHQAAEEALATFNDSLSDVRFSIDQVAGLAQKLWDELLRLADYCFSGACECPPGVLDRLRSAFTRLGYTIYGLPGEPVDHPAEFDIIALKPNGSTPRSVLEVIQIGLRCEDGSVRRRAKVVVSG